MYLGKKREGRSVGEGRLGNAMNRKGTGENTERRGARAVPIFGAEGPRIAVDDSTIQYLRCGILLYITTRLLSPEEQC